MKTQIVLGKDQDRKDVSVDLRTFLRTRGLVQAASGGGKSRTLRRMGEQFFGKVPTWIIDREGEFPSLRERFGYVLVGKGGETPMDVRSAELVCERLLQHKASAIFDLYELKDPDRHRWVRVFLTALMNAPKSLWGDLVLMVDEAHRFAPEKDKSEALGSMVDVACDGRKHGICAVYFTQRLGKVSKDASAELLNRCVGKTIEDIDVDRASDLFSVRRSDRHDFEKSLKGLQPGEFWCFGPAIATDRILVKMGPVATTHPEPGSPSAAAPPPLPEKLKALLPKLADLPKEAEEEKRTVADLRAEVRSLKAQLTAKPKAAPMVPAPKPAARVETKIVEVSTLSPADVRRVERLIVRMEKLAGKLAPLTELHGALSSSMKDLGAKLRDAAEAAKKVRKMPPAAPAARLTAPPPPRKVAKPATVPTNGLNGDISNPQRNILRAIAEFESIGVECPTRAQVAGWLGIRVSGSYKNNLGANRSRGLIDYRGDDGVVLTEDGRAKAPAPEIEPTSKAIFEHVLRAVSGPQGAILKVVRDAFPDWVSREDVAAALGIAVSGSYKNNLGALHTAEMMEYGTGEHRNMVRCAAWMFLEASVAAQ